MKHPIGILAAYVVFAGSGTCEAQTPAANPALAERHETAEQHDARMAWWREAKFGMFIHWGLYALAGGEWNGKYYGGGYCEWIMANAKVPIAEYTAFAKNFNPVKYDAEKWVLAAKEAGMKYVVVTAKHHDGFAMYKSAASSFNIVDATPFGRDPLKELAEACRKHGLKLGIYYSQFYDWHHPGGAGGDWDPAHKGEYETYVKNIAIPQLRELLTNYGDVAILWFDMGSGTKSMLDAVLDCNPKIIINDRLGAPAVGDTITPEGFVPARGYPGRDWETCMTMNGTWGYDKRNRGWASTAQLLRHLCNIASKGGNYLLNVGPNELGEIPDGSLERLAQVGEWLKVNGEAIYGSSGSPFRHAPSWGWITSKGTRLYLCLDKMPADHQLVLPELTTKISRAWFLTDPKRQPLTITTAENGTPTLLVPDPVPVKIGENPEVIVVELAARPFATLLEFALPGMPDATIAGTDIRIEVPQATDLTRLAPVYHTGSPLVTGDPVSGSCNDFTKPLVYRIKGADGSTKSYRVTVTPKQGAIGLPNRRFEQFTFVGEFDPAGKTDFLCPTWTFHRPNPGELGVMDLLEYGGNGGQAPVPAGTRYCVYMRGAGNGISQTLHFDKGTYTVSFDVIKRTGYEPHSPLHVTIDGKPVFTMDAATIKEAWTRPTSPAFPVTAGAHVLGFAIGEGGGMHLIDNVEIQYGQSNR